MEMLMELSVWITALVSPLVLGLLKVAVGWKDKSFDKLMGAAVTADGAVVGALKSIQPLFLAAITIALGAAGGQITGGEAPVAAAVAAAPVTTVLGVVLRELWVRFVKPRMVNL